MDDHEYVGVSVALPLLLFRNLACRCDGPYDWRPRPILSSGRTQLMQAEGSLRLAYEGPERKRTDRLDLPKQKFTKFTDRLIRTSGHGFQLFQLHGKTFFFL